jgi:hypothetical protein
MMDTTGMAARPVQISIDEELLQRIDADPDTRERGRSAFIRSAVEAHFRMLEQRQIEANLIRSYAGQADAMLDEVRDLLDDQEWPKS